MIEAKDYSKTYDVVVVGGGMSGVCAAIAAGRNGSKVLIVDQNGYFGGALTSMGVGPMMTFFAGSKQVIKGVGQQIIDRLVQGGFSPGHILDSTNYISYVTPFDAEGMKFTLDQMVSEAGCDVLFHTYLIGQSHDGERVNSIVVANKDGVSRISAEVFIDASGDADLATACGVPFQLGRLSDNAAQPMTMNMKVYGVNDQALKEAVLSNPEKFPRLNRDIDVMKTAERLSFVGFDDEFKAAKTRGEISIPREDILFFETNNPGEFILNTTRIINESGVNAESLTKAEMVGRQQCQELFGFLVNHIPGFENAHIALTGPSVGVRGSRQIKGKYTLEADDITGDKHSDSVIAHNGYPIDIHNPKGEGTVSVMADKAESNNEVSFDKSSFDRYYEIPFDIMVTNEFSNLIVTGRCVSASFEAQAAIRTTPTMTALGQAAGTAAAQAVGGDVRALDMPALQSTLIAQGTYIEK